jgi:hypothetical protein
VKTGAGKNIYSVSKSMCLKNGGTWRSRDFNFDNSIQGMITLFVLSTMEGWPTIMYNSMDGNDEDTGPQKGALYGVSWFFVAYIFVGSLILINLFIGVIGYRFNQEKMRLKMEGSVKHLNEKQAEWHQIMSLLKNLQP